MNIKAILGVILVLAIGLPVGYYLITMYLGDSLTAVLPNAGKTSMASLFGQKGSYKCSFSSSDPNAQSSGEIFINDNKIKGQFSSKVPQLDKTVNSYLVRDDNFTYVWSSLLPQGMKFKNQGEVGGGNGKLVDTLGFKEGVEVDYKCEEWKVEESLFVPPKEVSFVEIAI